MIRTQILMRKVQELTPFDKNNKIHPDSQIDLLAKNIQEFGFNVPLLIDKTDTIIAGHGRLLAAKKLEMSEVPVILVDDLSEAQVKALRIADNRLTELAETDWDMLKSEMNDLKLMDYDISITGYDFDEVAGTQLEELQDVEPSAYDDVKDKCTVKLGDVYLLGDHRLMCGDSCKSEDVGLLMLDEKADMCFTDPPYNIDYSDLAGNHNKIKNDKMNNNNFKVFLNQALQGIPLNSYVCCNWKYYHLFHEALEEIERPVKACIVWDKETRVQNLDKYFKQHEFVLYTGKLGGEKTIRGDVYRLNRERSDVHPTMKPIELCSTFIQDSSIENGTVLDLFGGSGSTLIACEQLKRKCFMMELDPVYVQIIITRWETLTGKTASKL